jgi:putative glutamine amidotransferase
MTVKIAIPEPTSRDAEYNARALPQYIQALDASGATALVIPLNATQDRVARWLRDVQGVLLPGSRYDVDPERYGEEPIPACAEPDPPRTAVDELLLQDAFNLRKPILGICQGLQTLNVWRNGTLIQDLKTTVNHQPGREVIEAHPVEIAKHSRLAALLSPEDQARVQVNSSHHQAVCVPGDKLLVSALSPEDGVIEALELNAPQHFVVAVQWHPERTYRESRFSQALFAAFVNSAATWQPPQIEESIAGLVLEP